MLEKGTLRIACVSHLIRHAYQISLQMRNEQN